MHCLLVWLLLFLCFFVSYLGILLNCLCLLRACLSMQPKAEVKVAAIADEPAL